MQLYNYDQTPQSAEAPAGPKPSATQRYREAVFAAVDSGRDNIDQDISEAGWKLKLDVSGTT